MFMSGHGFAHKHISVSTLVSAWGYHNNHCDSIMKYTKYTSKPIERYEKYIGK